MIPGGYSLHPMIVWIALQPWIAIRGVSINILVPITIVGWYEEGHLVITFLPHLNLWNGKSFDKLNCVNGIGTFQSEDAMHVRSSVGCRRSQTVIERLHLLENKFLDLWVCSVNVGTLRSWSGETVDIRT